MRSKKTDFKEKRRHARARHVVTIYHRLHRKAEASASLLDWNLSLTENISAGGVLFDSAVRYAPGNILDLRIVMSGALDIYSGLGKVVRIEEKRVVNSYKTAIYFAKVKGAPRRKTSFQKESSKITSQQSPSRTKPSRNSRLKRKKK